MSVDSSLGHMPSGQWTFDGDVTRVFDDMLVRSIPQYNAMRKAVFDIGREYVQDNTAIVDLGCARGEALMPFVSFYGTTNTCVGIEVSEPMIKAAQERLGIYAIVRNLDLRREYPQEYASLTLSVLTMQFVPIEHRLRVMRDAYKHTVNHGAFILVEKVLGANADIDAVLVKHYYRMKTANGYTQEEIDRKRLALEGVLVPVTARWNEEMLELSGFKYIDCFWRYLNFAAWLAVRED